MNLHLNGTIRTMLSPYEVRNMADAQLPQYGWRTGESEAQGARYVAGHDPDGAGIRLWFDEEPGTVFAQITILPELVETAEAEARIRVGGEDLRAFLSTIGELSEFSPVD